MAWKSALKMCAHTYAYTISDRANPAEMTRGGLAQTQGAREALTSAFVHYSHHLISRFVGVLIL